MKTTTKQKNKSSNKKKRSDGDVNRPCRSSSLSRLQGSNSNTKKKKKKIGSLKGNTLKNTVHKQQQNTLKEDDELKKKVNALRETYLNNCKIKRKFRKEKKQQRKGKGIDGGGLELHWLKIGLQQMSSLEDESSFSYFDVDTSHCCHADDEHDNCNTTKEEDNCNTTKEEDNYRLQDERQCNIWSPCNDQLRLKTYHPSPTSLFHVFQKQHHFIHGGICLCTYVC
jgi:hypothetical protein